MTLARERFTFTAEAEYNNRIAAKGDLEFYVSDQWDQGTKADRASANRPCLTINRLPQFTRQITNGLRQNMPAVHIIPVHDSDEEVAEILEGMVRHIQDISQSGIAYSTANLNQVVAGQGFFRVVTEYLNEKSFDQEIKIKRIKNALSVYVDPNAIEPDYSDARYMFITSDLTRAAFEERYPDKTIVSDDYLSAMGDSVRTWLSGNRDVMRIAEYWTVEEKRSKLYQLEDGSIVDKVPEGQKALKDREVVERKVMCRHISGVEVLEEYEWEGKYIPIIPCLGEDIDVDGTRIIKGMVRDAQDPQRMYNYWATAQTEMIALAPKAPYIIAEGQLEGYKAIWENANTTSYSALPYKPTDIMGHPVPPPQRQVAEPPVQAMVQAMSQAAEDLKATTGIYDASLGAKSNETSGKAINARKMQGDVSNYHFMDNFSYSIQHLGRILLDLIPKIYVTQRIVRILGQDDSVSYKTINGPSGEKDANGIEKIYDITTGQYDVTVDVGPSYKTKRQQDSESIGNLLQANPELWATCGDLLVKSMDWPDAEQISERLRKMLPPQLQDAPDGQQEIPQQVKQMLDQQSQQIEQMTAVIHQLSDERDMKLYELKSKETIEFEKMKTQITIEAMKVEAGASQSLMQAEFASIANDEQLSNQAAMAIHNAGLNIAQAHAMPQPQQNGVDNSTENSPE